MFFIRYGQFILTSLFSQIIVPILFWVKELSLTGKGIVPTLSKNCPYLVKELSLTGKGIVPMTPFQRRSYQGFQPPEKKKGFRKILERRKEPVFLL